jgi:four helix bundle protein
MMAVQSFRDLEVWKVAMDLAAECYRATKAFPKDELFGMTSQIRRAATSIPANIAEGQGREHTKEFLHFLSVARGSLMETHTHLLLSQRVGLLNEVDLKLLLTLCERISQMLSRLRQALERKL